jgi:electron transport complex protein RnfG
MKLLAPAGVLTLICGAAALALAGVNIWTEPNIAEQERQFTLRSIRKSLPAFDNEPDQDVVVIGEGESKVCVYRGRKGSEIVGVALAQTNGKGYSGDIKVLVGLTAEGQLTCEETDPEKMPADRSLQWLGLQILDHKETPGLGAVMEEEPYRRQYCGHSLSDETFWAVRKDGGEVDQLTGATITSKSVTKAVHAGLQFFQEHREEILTGEPGRCEE